jgi:sigma-B regulation protein RsbU (phosphoserine phosphatase)
LSDTLPIESEDLADLYENAPCGYVSLAPDGRIVKLNRTLANWIGRPADELIGNRFGDCMSFGGRIAFETHLAPLLRLQGHVGEIALDLVDPSGAKIPVIANAAEKRSAEGAHLLTRMTLFKAVDRRAYERSLIAARDKAENAVEAEHETAVLREQFIAVLGHDLRNPIAALSSGVALLGKEELSDRGRFIVDAMGQSVGRAAALIDDVLDFARGRLGEGIILSRNARKPLTPVLEQVVQEIRVAGKGRAIQTRFAIREPVDCDRQRIGQLAANLISNAVAHGASDQPVLVEAATEDDAFWLTVTNHGEPIPPSARAQLFQPFVRGMDQNAKQGLGLGLFIVNEIAKAHGGTMVVESNETRTCFRFSMPQTADAADKKDALHDPV